MNVFAKKGVSTIAAVLVLLSLSALGIVIAHLIATGSESQSNDLLSAEAFYVTQGGIEYAVKKIYDGQSEIVNPPGKSFGSGSFTVSRSGRTLTVIGTVGNAVRQHQVDSPTEADCTLIDADNADLKDHDTTVDHINFRKVCLTQITIAQMQFNWLPNNGERLKKIRIESSTIYDNPSGVPAGTLLDTADYTATIGNNNVINEIKWDSDMEDKTVTMNFIMGDASTRSVTFETED